MGHKVERRRRTAAAAPVFYTLCDGAGTCNDQGNTDCSASGADCYSAATQALANTACNAACAAPVFYTLCDGAGTCNDQGNTDCSASGADCYSAATQALANTACNAACAAPVFYTLCDGAGTCNDQGNTDCSASGADCYSAATQALANTACNAACAAPVFYTLCDGVSCNDQGNTDCSASGADCYSAATQALANTACNVVCNQPIFYSSCDSATQICTPHGSAGGPTPCGRDVPPASCFSAQGTQALATAACEEECIIPFTTICSKTATCTDIGQAACPPFEICFSSSVDQVTANTLCVDTCVETHYSECDTTIPDGCSYLGSNVVFPLCSGADCYSAATQALVEADCAANCEQILYYSLCNGANGTCSSRGTNSCSGANCYSAATQALALADCEANCEPPTIAGLCDFSSLGTVSTQNYSSPVYTNTSGFPVTVQYGLHTVEEADRLYFEVDGVIAHDTGFVSTAFTDSDTLGGFRTGTKHGTVTVPNGSTAQIFVEASGTNTVWALKATCDACECSTFDDPFSTPVCNGASTEFEVGGILPPPSFPTLVQLPCIPICTHPGIYYVGSVKVDSNTGASINIPSGSEYPPVGTVISYHTSVGCSVDIGIVTPAPGAPCEACVQDSDCATYCTNTYGCNIPKCTNYTGSDCCSCPCGGGGGAG